IDIILGLIKSGIKKIEAVGINVLTPFEDIANARITFENGCVANITASRVSDETMRKIRIFQKNAYISLDYKDAQASVYKKEGSLITKKDLPIEKEEPLKKELESFIDCVRQHKAPIVSGEIARAALAVALEIQDQIWQKKQILIIAGEPSGDLAASNLIKALRQINPGLKFSGLGGELMQEAGVKSYFDIKNFAVMGFFDVLKKLPKFIALKNLILKKIKEERPQAIILVDFSGFNLRLAKIINNKIPTIYYVSPQIWASRLGRIKIIKKYISKMIVLFKFEQDFYRKYGIEVEFCGHHLIDIEKPTMSKEQFYRKYKLSAAKKCILLMTGSREAEVKNILPIMKETCRLIYDGLGEAQFIIAKSKYVEHSLYKRILKGAKIDFKLIEDLSYDCINAADFGLIAAGTATLETALMQKPFVIIYKVGLLNYLLYKPQLKVPFVGMVNIIAGKRIIPEFIQYNARPKPIADYVVYTLNNPAMLNQIKQDLAQIRNLLGQPGSSARAAKIILDFIK
ncbi:MAG: lipid-A-disaccharide synthase, partial [Candidatus Omnitrophica bacterium]|nr:lipid-A-disaccharide synthase [Candidatus Omnitrophota bacterium]